MSRRVYRARRMIALLIAVAIAFATFLANSDMWQPAVDTSVNNKANPVGAAADLLATLPVKGRAAKTGYERTQFGDGWAMVQGCDTRNIILHRDLKNVAVGENCKVLSGTLDDPYTGKTITFQRGADTSDDVQIDHVVALSNAWQTGAQQLTLAQRQQLANDPLELLAVDGPANQEKSDGDAATWLPANKLFRCQYVARQVAVKSKYGLWVTPAEKDAIGRILASCPSQPLPSQ